MSAPTTELVDYGIHTERSDVRAHVSVVNRSVYVFPTDNAVEAISQHRPKLVAAFQPGVQGKTAEGWLVRPDWIADLRSLKFYSWSCWSEFRPDLTTSEKGALAVCCVLELMRRGRFPFWLEATEDERREAQIKGTDILVFCQKRIQVKCDYRSGPTPGSGFLFVQRAERNPLGRH